MDKEAQNGSIIIYRSKDGKAELEVKLQEETVWLTQDQMTKLFDRDQSVISRHINNVFKEKELEKKSNMHFLHIPLSDKPVVIYSLDVIISVGYRVKSLRGTRFRIWSTSVLKDHILKGYTLNEKRLREKGFSEFEEAVALIKRTAETKALSGDESKGLLEVITTYASTWLLLQKYDKEQIQPPKTHKVRRKFEYDFCRRAINELKSELLKKKEASDIFGKERGEGFMGILGSVHQTFDKKDLYPSIEEKAAHLLYFIIKDHPFTDGNKRIASFLFIVYLAKNNYLYRRNGERKINDNALTAMAILIAESNPKQKSLMTLLIMHFLAEKKD